MMLCHDHVMMCLSGLLGSQITRNNRTDICILYYDAGCTDMERQVIELGLCLGGITQCKQTTDLLGVTEELYDNETTSD